MDGTLPGSSVQGISQTELLEWVAIPFPGDLPDPKIEPMSPALAGEFFTTEPPGKLRIKYPQVNNSMHIFETPATYCQLSCQRSCPNEITRSYFQEITAAKFFRYFLYPTVKLTHVTYLHNLEKWVRFRSLWSSRKRKERVL